MDIIKGVLGAGAKAAGATANTEEARKEQARINEAEIAGAPNSKLRLWRSCLGWALTIGFIWEVMARPIIAAYWPQISLPPSFIREITSLLLGMLGLGF